MQLRNMKRTKVYIYREKDGDYSCYLDDSAQLNYGLVGEGGTAQEAIDEWNKCYADMKLAFADGSRGEFVETEFEFAYDLASMLNFYAGRFTFSGLSRITGVSAAQLSQYANGYRHASPKTTKKIQNALRLFGNELCQVTLV